MIEVSQSSKDNQWYWHYRARNGRITADGSEGYYSASNARRAARKAGIALAFASVLTSEVLR